MEKRSKNAKKVGRNLRISSGFSEYSHYEVIFLQKTGGPSKKLPATPLRHVFDTLTITALVLFCAFAALPLYAGDKAEEAAEPSAPAEAALQAPQHTVVVDAGHGGADGGAVGSKSGVVEAGLNLTVARLVQAGLEEAGVEVRLTREGEEALAEGKQADMQARKAIMNQPEVDLVVSIHMNKFTDPSVKGPMAFYMEGSEEGQKLAEMVIEAVCEAIGSPQRKANPGDYFIIRESPAPSVLVECGFLSNSEDEALLQQPAHQRKLAEGVIKGVLTYLQELE